jgi:hypothetical protein
MSGISKREIKRKDIDLNKRCQNTTIKTRGKKLGEVSCTKQATCVIRKHGKEFRACNSHKSEGVFVRRL